MSNQQYYPPPGYGSTYPPPPASVYPPPQDPPPPGYPQPPPQGHHQPQYMGGYQGGYTYPPPTYPPHHQQSQPQPQPPGGYQGYFAPDHYPPPSPSPHPVPYNNDQVYHSQYQDYHDDDCSFFRGWYLSSFPSSSSSSSFTVSLPFASVVSWRSAFNLTYKYLLQHHVIRDFCILYLFLIFTSHGFSSALLLLPKFVIPTSCF